MQNETIDKLKEAGYITVTDDSQGIADKVGIGGSDFLYEYIKLPDINISSGGHSNERVGFVDISKQYMDIYEKGSLNFYKNNNTSFVNDASISSRGYIINDNNKLFVVIRNVAELSSYEIGDIIADGYFSSALILKDGYILINK